MKFLTQSAQLALDTVLGKPTQGIPTGLCHIMEHSVIERLAGAQRGDYKKDPHGVYIRMLQNIGVNMVDQYLATNPLTMGDHGYENDTDKSPTTGGMAVLDGVVIDSPEAVVEHLEQYEFPRLQKMLEEFNEDHCIRNIINEESEIQQMLGPSILKLGYAHLAFPNLLYHKYGYGPYFMAYALFPEIIQECFKLQADIAELNNRAVVKAYQYADLPLYHRLDHDMADSRGTLVSISSLERFWFPEFYRSIKPAVDAGFTLLWHCDGNLMDMVPSLIECGVNGFQGFQYEDGMDYKKICSMKSRDGANLVIMAGVSVTRSLPMGTPDAIKKEMKFLVENGPKTGLFLAMSSSCAPGVPWENIKTFVEGVKYYRQYGRA